MENINIFQAKLNFGQQFSLGILKRFKFSLNTMLIFYFFQKFVSVMEDLPPGWIKDESSGRTIFFSPSPGRIKIDCRATLKHHQRKGKFLDVADLNFIKRKKIGKKVVEAIIEEMPAVKVDATQKDDKIKV